MFKYLETSIIDNKAIPLISMYGHILPWAVYNAFQADEHFEFTGYYLHKKTIGDIDYYFYHDIGAIPSSLAVYQIDGVPLIEHVDYDLIGSKVYLDWEWRNSSIVINADGTEYAALWEPVNISMEPAGGAMRMHPFVPLCDVIELDNGPLGEIHYYYPRLLPRQVALPPVYYDKRDAVWTPDMDLYIKAERKRFTIYKTSPYVNLDLSHYYVWNGSAYDEYDISNVLYFSNTGEIKFDEYIPYDTIALKLQHVDGLVMNLNINPTVLELLHRTEFMPSFMVGYDMMADVFLVLVHGFDHRRHFYRFDNVHAEVHSVGDLLWIAEFRLKKPLERLMKITYDIHRRRGGYV